METHKYWWKEAKIYELYIDKFAGDIPGLTRRLDYFTALGINTLHLLPHYPSGGVDDGYDITNYRAVRAELGDLDDFKTLLDTAHARGIRIITDFVLNHTSNKHPWFVEASASKHNARRDFYHWRDEPRGFEGAPNMYPDIKPNTWVRNNATNDYYFSTFYPQQPDLNWDNPEVFTEMTAHMEFWADMGVDGFRLDAAGFLIKRENTISRGLKETHQTIKKIRAQLEAKHPDVIMLAESAEMPELAKDYFGQGDECHMAYSFPLCEQLWMALAFRDRIPLQAMIERSFKDIPENCGWAVFLRNHDELSLATLEEDEREHLIDTLDPLHEYLFNKGTATALRVASALHGDRQKIIEALELLYSIPGTPIMYYGDEIGMRNLPVQEGILHTPKYCRGVFDWAEAEAQIQDPDSLWNATRDIIRRSTH